MKFSDRFVSNIGLFIRERRVEPFLISEQRMGFMELRTQASMLLGFMRLFSLNRSLSKAVEIVGYRFLRNDRSVYGRPGTGGGGVGLCLKSHLKNRLVAKSFQVGVEYIFIEIRLPHKTLLVSSVYRPPSTSVVCHLLDAQGYGLLEVPSGLDWNAVRFISDLDSKFDYLYGLLSELIDVFASVRNVKVGRSNSLSGIRHWMDSDIEQAVAERNRAYKIWRWNVNRVKGDRNWLAFVDRRRIAKSLLDARRSAFVSINLDPDLPPKKLCCCVTNSEGF
jgi:hypothetical protein